MAEFTLYTYTFLSRAERVLWCLDELGLSYELKKLDPMKGDIFTPEFTRLNPMRKVPVLIHHLPDGKERVLIESIPILEYLNNYAKGHLKPAAIEECYAYDKAMFFGATELESYLWVANQSTILRGIYHWPLRSEKEALRQVKRAMPEVFKWLSHQNYIAGNAFTLADIYYYQLIKWAIRFGVDAPVYVERYLQRLEQRPAFPAGWR